MLPFKRRGAVVTGARGGDELQQQQQEPIHHQPSVVPRNVSKGKKIRSLRKKQNKRVPFKLIVFMTAVLLVLFGWALISMHLLQSNKTVNKIEAEISKGEMLVKQNFKKNFKKLRRAADETDMVDNKDTEGERIDKIVNKLMGLAQMAPDELRVLLESENDNKHPFMLNSLINGECPWKDNKNNVMDWLPKRPSMSLQTSEWFKDKNGNNNKSSHRVLAYYEHLSKAGGTSFCKLAVSNMPKKEVPAYYCMPSEPNMIDARIGSWDIKKIEQYAMQDKPEIRFVSNEWEPFNLAFLENFHHHDTNTEEGEVNKSDDTEQLHLLFITSIRNPINRLLSAHKFWGILNNSNEKKPSLGQWLKNLGKRAKRWKLLSGDFMGNVGRFNFATWKFSGGALPNIGENQIENELLDKEKPVADSNQLLFPPNSVWEDPFIIAVRTLSQFDLVVPMEYMSSKPSPITQLIGWTDFDKSHVVNIGGVVNTDAKKNLSDKQYDILWNANRLDMLLYSWSCAVYLARMNCSI